MINGDLASSILYTTAGALFIAAVVFALIALLAMRDRRHTFTPQEQMRERVPWPPPSDSGWVTVSHRKQEPMALPRGDHH